MTATIRKIDEYNRPMHLFSNNKRAGIVQPDNFTTQIVNNKLTTPFSNGIISVPNRIKYEINTEGAIRLKAGSEVFLPKSDGSIEAIIVDKDTPYNDRAWTTGSKRAVLVFYCPELNELRVASAEKTATDTGVYHQETAPSSEQIPSYGHCLWDNGKELKNTNDNGATWQNVTLPILYGNPAFPSSEDTGWGKHIREVFNGFGFFGRKIFTLPGAMVAIPDGLNEDGSFKNEIFTQKQADIYDLESQSSKYAVFSFSTDGSIHCKGSGIRGWGAAYCQGVKLPSFDYLSTSNLWFFMDIKNNILYRFTSEDFVMKRYRVCMIGKMVKAGGQNNYISDFKMNPPLIGDFLYSAISDKHFEYNSKNIIKLGHLTNWDGDTISYTAPNDGYMYIEVRDTQKAAGNTAWIDVNGVAFGYGTRWGSNGPPTMIDKVFPVNRGDKIQLKSNWLETHTKSEVFAYIGHYEFWTK